MILTAATVSFKQVQFSHTSWPHSHVSAMAESDVSCYNENVVIDSEEQGGKVALNTLVVNHYDDLR